GGKVEAFLSCSPILGASGFFLHDLLRNQNTINGVSEMLTVAALKALKESGVKRASLGVASLAGLDEAGVNADYPWLNRVMRWVFSNSRSMVRFKALYHYKMKFGPTRVE